MRNLQNLEPTLKALADVGPEAGHRAGLLPDLPVHARASIDRAIRGDYMNQFIIFDFTVPRLKRTLFLGTRWGEENAKLVPAPGDPWYATYTYDPLQRPVQPAARAGGGRAAAGGSGRPAAAASTQSALTADVRPRQVPPAAGRSPAPGTGPPPGPGPQIAAAPDGGGN